jgi:CheY-like chemotaxis protein
LVPVTPSGGQSGPRPEGASDDQTLTVLVVEDDPAVAELLRTMLNDVPGWGATVVHDAGAALEVARHVRVDVLVLDLHLPGISGLELITLWRTFAALPLIPVILTTVEPGHPDVRAAVKRGEVTTVVAKPFDVDDLVAAVRRVVGGVGGAGEAGGAGARS